MFGYRNNKSVTMNKDRESQMMDKEDSLALEMFGRVFTSLEGHEKLAIHNKVLEMFGLRQAFKFWCTKCKCTYQEDVEGELIGKYTKELEDSHSTFIGVVCEDCEEQQERTKQEKEFLATIDELSAKIPKILQRNGTKQGKKRVA